MLRFTTHATQRMAQRAISESDVELASLLGIEVSNGLLVRKKDCQAIERRLREAIKKIHHLDGKRIVERDGQVITAYHATTRMQKRLLRKL